MSAEIIHGDCLEVMRGMGAASVDAIVTDPPYFRVKGEPWDRAWDSDDAFLAWVGALCDEWRRLLKPNGSLYVFASPRLARRVESVIAERFQVLNSIRWEKGQGWHRKAERESLRSYLSPWEAVIFAEQFGCEYQDAALALHKQVYAPIGRVVQQKREAAGLSRHDVDRACSPSRKPTGLCYRWEEGACLPTEAQYVALCRVCGDERADEALGPEYEALRSEYEALRSEYETLRRPFQMTDVGQATDIWRFPTVPPRPGKHPCEKPVVMLEHIIRTSTRPGALILDAFAGSGATAVAALNLGRRFIGCDSSERWVAYSRQRVSTAQAQLFYEGAA